MDELKVENNRKLAKAIAVDKTYPDCVATCGLCDGSLCAPFRGEARSYDGIRFTADGFDCSLHIAIDSFNTCSFNCLYCFSNFLSRDLEKRQTFRLGVFPLKTLERFLAGGKRADDSFKTYRKAWWQGHRHPVTGKEMPIPLQWGALGEPFDDIERQRGWGLEAIELFKKYDVPVRISTKGAHLLLTDPRYLDALTAPNFWVACSLISVDDDLMAKVDRGAPPPSERLKMLAELSRRGVPTSLRFRPILRGVSDSTEKHPYAWRELLDRAAEAGVQAISMEFVFVPGAQPPHIKRRMQELDSVVGWPMTEFYRRSTACYGACLRSERAWKEDFTYAVREHAKKLGMRFAISDPHFKELNDVGNCCGLPDDPDDPHYDYFGGWSRKNATNALVEARDLGKKVHAGEYIPDWAWDHPMSDMCLMTKASQAMQIYRWSWGDKLRSTWNDLKSPRGPFGYFEGVLWPVGIVKRGKWRGDVIYEYREYKLKHPDLPEAVRWDLNEDYPGLEKLPPIAIPKRWNKTHHTELGAEVGNPGPVRGVGGAEPVKANYRGGCRGKIRRKAK